MFHKFYFNISYQNKFRTCYVSANGYCYMAYFYFSKYLLHRFDVLYTNYTQRKPTLTT